MNDELFDRTYQQGRAAFNRDLGTVSGKLAASIGDSLRTLNRIQWSAPWKKQVERC